MQSAFFLSRRAVDGDTLLIGVAPLTKPLSACNWAGRSYIQRAGRKIPRNGFRGNQNLDGKQGQPRHFSGYLFRRRDAGDWPGKV